MFIIETLMLVYRYLLLRKVSDHASRSGPERSCLDTRFTDPSAISGSPGARFVEAGSRHRREQASVHYFKVTGVTSHSESNHILCEGEDAQLHKREQRYGRVPDERQQGT